MRTLIPLTFMLVLFSATAQDSTSFTFADSLRYVIDSNITTYILIESTEIEDPNYITGGSSEYTFYYNRNKHEVVKIDEIISYDWAESKTSWYFQNYKCVYIQTKLNSPGEMYSAEELGITEEELWQRGGEAKTITYSEGTIYLDKEENALQYSSKEKTVSASETEPDLSDEMEVIQDREETFPDDLIKHGKFLLNWIAQKK